MRTMKLLREILFWWLFAFCAGYALHSCVAASTIGTEALVGWNAEADFSGGINRRPANASTQNLNAAIFMWSPKTNHTAPESADGPCYPEYQFQVSTSATFVNFIVNFRTPANMENRLSPFTNASGAILSNVPIYWRALYIGTNGWTNWTAPTWRFYVGVNATNWDRSMLRDESYLSNVAATRPYIGIQSSNRAPFLTFLQTNYPFGWLAVTDDVARVTNSYGGTNTELTWSTNGGVWPTGANFPTNAPDFPKLGRALLTYALTREQSLTQFLVIQFNKLVQWHTNVFFSRADFGSAPDVFPTYLLALGFDQLKPLLSTAQINGAVMAADRACRYALRGNNRAWSGPPLSPNTLDDSFEYLEQLLAWFSIAEQGTSHAYYDIQALGTLALAFFSESADARRLLDVLLNYGIARGHFSGGFNVINQGRGYAVLSTDAFLWNYINMAKAFPEAHLERTPNLQGLADWYPSVTPPGFRYNRTAQGDGGSGASTHMSTATFGQKLGLFTKNGEAWKAHQSALVHNNLFTPPGEVYWHDMWQTASLWPPPDPVTAPQYKVWIEGGWAVASTKALNDPAAFTNGIGVVVCAPPGGNQGTGYHSPEYIGDVEIWCAGANVTDSGAWTLGDSFGFDVDSHNMPKINGYGPRVSYQYGKVQTLPFYARIIAATNTAEFFYVGLDLIRAYTNEYNLNLTSAVNIDPIITKMERHVFFSRTGKTLSIYDSWSTRSNAEFSVNWPVSFGLTNLTGSNFQYSATNFAGQTVSNFVSQIASGLALTNMIGSNVLRNPRTGVWVSDGLDASGSSGGVERRWRNHIWYRSSGATSNGHSLLVISFQEPGKSAPVVTRLDDNTFASVYDGVTETITFGTNYAGASTVLVDLDVVQNPEVGESEPIVSSSRGKIINARLRGGRVN
ncbi:MAG TPA: hypothetical protein VK530_17790 [Candidatus Acidoferrum sp.]|nr:hypothetical protein [Candidatus Acidoferrum sp.]